MHKYLQSLAAQGTEMKRNTVTIFFKIFSQEAFR